MIQSVKPAFEPQHNSIKQICSNFNCNLSRLKNEGTMTMHYICTTNVTTVYKVTSISRDMVYY